VLASLFCGRKFFKDKGSNPWTKEEIRNDKKENKKDKLSVAQPKKKKVN